MSKVTVLPTKPSFGRPRLAAARVAEDDQRRVLGRAGGDGEHAAHALALELGRSEDLDLDRLVGGGDLARPVGDVGGIGDVGRQVLEVAGAVGRRRGDPGDLGDPAVVAGADQGQGLELGTIRRRRRRGGS